MRKKSRLSPESYRELQAVGLQHGRDSRMDF